MIRRISRERTGDGRSLTASASPSRTIEDDHFARIASSSSWFARERWLCDVLARAFPRALLPPTELQQLWRKHNRQAAPASSHQPREDAAHHRRIYGRAWRQRALHPPGGDWDCRGKGLKDPRTGGEAPSPPSSSGSGRIRPGGIQPSILWGRLACRGKETAAHRQRRGRDGTARKASARRRIARGRRNARMTTAAAAWRRRARRGRGGARWP